MELDAVVVSVDIATAVWRHVAVVNDCLAVESRPIRCIVNSTALDLYRGRKDGNIEIREITTLRLGSHMSHCALSRRCREDRNGFYPRDVAMRHIVNVV